MARPSAACGTARKALELVTNMQQMDAAAACLAAARCGHGLNGIPNGNLMVNDNLWPLRHWHTILGGASGGTCNNLRCVME